MTLYHVIKPNGTYTSENYVGALEYGTPAWATLRQLVGIKEDQSLEHVTVLWQGKRAHMFVDEEGIMHKLSRNEKATRIYYNNVFSRMRLGKQFVYNDLSVTPDLKARELEDVGFQIVGIAVLWEGDME